MLMLVCNAHKNTYMYTDTKYRQLQLSGNFYYSIKEINILEFKIKLKEKIFNFFQKVMTTLKKNNLEYRGKLY